MKIRSETFEIRGSEILSQNPLPNFRMRKPVKMQTGDDFPEELAREFDFYSNRSMPYLMQDRRYLTL